MRLCNGEAERKGFGGQHSLENQKESFPSGGGSPHSKPSCGKLDNYDAYAIIGLDIIILALAREP